MKVGLTSDVNPHDGICCEKLPSVARVASSGGDVPPTVHGRAGSSKPMNDGATGTSTRTRSEAGNRLTLPALSLTRRRATKVPGRRNGCVTVGVVVTAVE